MRQIQLQRLPVIAIIKRHPHCVFCSGKQQPFAPRVFTNHANEIHVANTANRFLPGLTEVARSEDMRAQIIEIVSIDETIKTPAGTFKHCLHLKETTPLEGDVSHKWYAPGVGMVKDDEFELAEKP